MNLFNIKANALNIPPGTMIARLKLKEIDGNPLQAVGHVFNST